MKARLRFRGLPRADTKITVGFGPQAAALNPALSAASDYVQLICARKECLACMPSIARRPHHARNRRLRFRGDYAEGLGRYLTGFLFRR
jgi:hypothetical protein